MGKRYAVYILKLERPGDDWEWGYKEPVDVFLNIEDARRCKKNIPHTDMSKPIIVQE